LRVQHAIDDLMRSTGGVSLSAARRVAALADVPKRRFVNAAIVHPRNRSISCRQRVKRSAGELTSNDIEP
jgi:hypothetical protein